MLITRQDRIRKRFLAEIESCAEMTFTDDQGAFKFDMTKYPNIQEHLMLDDELVLSWEETKDKLKVNGEFGYTFWDRSDRVWFEKSFEDNIVEEKEQEAMNVYSDKSSLKKYIDADGTYDFGSLYNIIEAESKALLQDVEDQIKKHVTYWRNIKWDFDDFNGDKNNLNDDESRDFYDNNEFWIIEQVDEEVEVAMIEASINFIRGMLQKTPNIRAYSAVQDGIRELWIDYNAKPIISPKEANNVK